MVGYVLIQLYFPSNVLHPQFVPNGLILSLRSKKFVLVLSIKFSTFFLESFG